MEPGLTRFPPGTRREPSGALVVGDCDVNELAASFGTPLLVYDAAALRERAGRMVAALETALPGREVTVAFASKSCPLPAVLGVLAAAGIHCDVASAGELRLAIGAGFPGERLVVHGNAKSDDDVRAAIAARAGLFVVDGSDDLDRLERLGAVGQPVLLRVTPGIDADTHPAIRTGHRESKFGVPLELAGALIERLRASAAVDFRGLHVHLGSQILDLGTFLAGAAALDAIEGVHTVDLGGGLGIPYRRGEAAPTIEDWAEALGVGVAEHLPGVRRIVVEPGRALVGPTGVTLYRVQTVKRYAGTVVAVDGGLSDNLEPLYGMAFDAVHADRAGGEESSRLVGHHCEEGDTLGTGIPLDDPKPGDLLAVPVTGAYTYTLANNYNATARAAVVLCDGGSARLVVRRETWADQTARFV